MSPSQGFTTAPPPPGKATSDKTGMAALAEALCIPAHTTKAILVIEAGQPIKLRVTRAIPPLAVDAITGRIKTVTERYQLTLSKEPA